MPGRPTPGREAFPAGLRALEDGLAAVNAWIQQSAFSSPLVLALPATPVDGQQISYVADAVNGVIWNLRYRAASESAHKWEFVGGGRLFAEVATSEATASGVYVNLATVGPSITLPLAGDYMVDHGARITTAQIEPWAGFMSFAVGGTAATDAHAIHAETGKQPGANSAGGSVARTQRLTGIVAAEALVAKYKIAGATAFFEQRWLTVTPIRVG